MQRRTRAGRALGAALLVAAAIAWLTGRATLIAAWLPALGYGLVASTFAQSLRRGREPLITTFCRLDFGRIPTECVAYTRRLTLIWALVMGLLTLEASILAATGLITWLGTATILNAGLMVALFVGEHAVRLVVFPHLPLSSPIRTGRIMFQAMRSRR